jgi:hypothetical protein
VSLSTAEVTAGISRSALATLKKNGDSPHAEPTKVVTDKQNLTTKVDIVGDGTRETPVIETPYRRLSVMETRDSYFILRDVSFVGSRADVSLIHLEPEQAHALAAVLASMEAKAAGEKPGLPTKRVRA